MMTTEAIPLSSSYLFNALADMRNAATISNYNIKEAREPKSFTIFPKG